MEQYLREYFLSRILVGFTVFKHKDIKLKVLPPTLEITYESNEIYRDVYENAFEAGLMEDAEVYDLLIERKMWTEADEKNLSDVLPKHIEYWQKELYKAAFKSSSRLKIRKYLRIAREEQMRLYAIRHHFDTYTAHGTANFSRYQYVINNCTYEWDGITPYDWSDVSVSQVVDYCNNNVMMPEVIREISRTQPWCNQWTACKANGLIFSKAGVELSMQQQLLLMWSKMYDNIQESPNCPHDSIIQDDDMLDGWLLIQREERDKDKNQKMGEEGFTRNEKIKNSQEVYLFAETVEDANQVDSLNDKRILGIKKQRLEQIKRQGKVKHQEFADVQQERIMQLTQAYTNHMKGNK